MKSSLFSAFRVLVIVLAAALRMAGDMAPESQVQGEVRDANGAIVAGVKVELLEAKTKRVVATVESGREGSFAFSRLAAGEYILRAEQKDFTATETALVVVANQRTSTRITLYPQGKNISVTVTAERWAAPGVVDSFQGRGRLEDVHGVQINTGKKTDVVLMDDLDANLAGNNQRQVFAKAPGISFWENDSSGVQLNLATRGLSPNRSWEFNTRQNGYDISSDVLGYPEAYFTPPLEALERVEIVRGAGALQYGTQFGGVVNFVTKPAPAGRKFSLETQQSFGNLGLFDTYNGVGGTLGKWDYASYFHPRQSVRGRNWFGVKWLLPAFTVSYLPSTRTRVQVQAFGLYGERRGGCGLPFSDGAAAGAGPAVWNAQPCGLCGDIVAGDEPVDDHAGLPHGADYDDGDGRAGGGTARVDAACTAGGQRGVVPADRVERTRWKLHAGLPGDAFQRHLAGGPGDCGGPESARRAGFEQ